MKPSLNPRSFNASCSSSEGFPFDLETEVTRLIGRKTVSSIIHDSAKRLVEVELNTCCLNKKLTEL